MSMAVGQSMEARRSSRPIRTGETTSSSTNTSMATAAPDSAPATKRDGPEQLRGSSRSTATLMPSGFSQVADLREECSEQRKVRLPELECIHQQNSPQQVLARESRKKTADPTGARSRTGASANACRILQQSRGSQRQQNVGQ